MATTVIIPIEEYKRLLESDYHLEELYGAGVDNWEWFESLSDESIDEIKRIIAELEQN